MSIAVVSLAGIVLFVWPFLGLGLPPEVPALAVTLGAVASLGLMEAGARRLDSGRLALLAALAAIDAALRLALVNGVGGFSPIFLLVICAGYEFGASYGFLVGAFSLLVSALVTGGIGPWLPYETFAVGWVGASSGLAGSVVRRPSAEPSLVAAGPARPRRPGRRRDRDRLRLRRPDRHLGLGRLLPRRREHRLDARAFPPPRRWPSSPATTR